LIDAAAAAAAATATAATVSVTGAVSSGDRNLACSFSRKRPLHLAWIVFLAIIDFV
jgi:hypothetical protein